MSKKNITIPECNEKGEYTFHGKKYVLGQEIVKGGCQGCAFYNRIDCESMGKTKVCVKKHKIFLRKLDNLD